MSRLETRLNVLLEKGEIDSSSENNKLRVKLSGDGTMLGNICMLKHTLTILEEGSQAMAAEGNHLIAVIKVPEDYDNLFGSPW